MKPNLIQLLANTALTASNLFIPILAIELGATKMQVGLIGAFYGLSILLSSYLFGQLAEIFNRRTILLLGLVTSASAVAIQMLAFDPISLGLARGLTGFSAGIFPAALITYVHSTNGRLCRFVSYGSLGFAAGSLIAGIISIYKGIFIASSAILMLSFILALSLPPIDNAHKSIHFFSTDPLRRNWHIYLPYLIRHTGACSIWIVFPLYLASLGADKFWIGVIYMVNPVAQFIIMGSLDRYRSSRLISIGYLFSMATFIGMALSQNYLQVLLLQLMVAASWSTLYIGSIQELMDRSEEKATAMGILSSTISTANIIGPLIGGLIAQYMGFRPAMYLAAALSFTGFTIYTLSPTFHRHVQLAPIPSQQ